MRSVTRHSSSGFCNFVRASATTNSDCDVSQLEIFLTLAVSKRVAARASSIPVNEAEYGNSFSINPEYVGGIYFEPCYIAQCLYISLLFQSHIRLENRKSYFAIERIIFQKDNIYSTHFLSRVLLSDEIKSLGFHGPLPPLPLPHGIFQ